MSFGTSYFSYSYSSGDSRLRLNHDFMRCQPLTPTIARPEYCAVFAKPKNTINNTLLTSAERGKSAWTKESR